MALCSGYFAADGKFVVRVSLIVFFFLLFLPIVSFAPAPPTPRCWPRSSRDNARNS